MITGAMVRGGFMRMTSLASLGKSWIRMMPKKGMHLGLGKVLQNPRTTGLTRSWMAPSMSGIRSMMSNSSNAVLMTTGIAAATTAGFIHYSKRTGLSNNHLNSAGIGLSLSRGRHTNLL